VEPGLLGLMDQFSFGSDLKDHHCAFYFLGSMVSSIRCQRICYCQWWLVLGQVRLELVDQCELKTKQVEFVKVLLRLFQLYLILMELIHYFLVFINFNLFYFNLVSFLSLVLQLH